MCFALRRVSLPLSMSNCNDPLTLNEVLGPHRHLSLTVFIARSPFSVQPAKDGDKTLFRFVFLFVEKRQKAAELLETILY